MQMMYFFKKASAILATATLALLANPGQACEIRVVECIYTDGRFTPFEAEFSTETSAAGVALNVKISQTLETGWSGNNWKFRTKLSGFVYGLYGSITDSSEFTILADNSFRTTSFSRSARVYGIFPVSPTSFKQKFEWDNWESGSVSSKYRGEWYHYPIEGSILDQALLPLQLRMDLLTDGPNLGTRTYRASSKKHVDDDFTFRFVKESEVQTPLGSVPTVIYELLKGQHKARMNTVEAGYDLDKLEGLVDSLITLRKSASGKERDDQILAAREQLNALLNVDASTIVSISEDEAKSGKPARGKGDDLSLVDKASEIEEGNARVFLWFSKKHAYLPVKLLAVIDGNSWSRAVISSIELNDKKLPFL